MYNYLFCIVVKWENNENFIYCIVVVHCLFKLNVKINKNTVYVKKCSYYTKEYLLLFFL